MFGTDSLLKILSSELFNFLLYRFDNKAKISQGIVKKGAEFMKSRKYSYLSGRGSEIPMIFQSFKLDKEDRILPKFSSSFVFEFYERSNIT
jgi:hypothetical protein